MIAGGKYFLLHHLLANSATIYEDAAIALSMLADDLRDCVSTNFRAGFDFASALGTE